MSSEALLLVNIGYALMLIALLARDILWLRGILVLAQSTFIAYGVVNDLPPAVYWNALFILINGYQIAHILAERRAVALPQHLRDLYETKFAALTRNEFQHFWDWGEINEYESGIIYREGDDHDEVILILAGEVRIVRRGRELARLGPGDFLGEISFLTGRSASADSIADGYVQYIGWNKERLWHLQEKKPDLLIKIQGILSREVTEKLTRQWAST